MTRSLLVDDRGPVRLLTLNRPEARNAIDDALATAIGAALGELDSDDGLRVGVITGSAPGFSAGMDLKAFAAGQRGQVPGRGFAGVTRHPPRKPLVAAIEGFALAGGLEIALACDLIVAARDARLGLPEPRLGIVAAAGGLLRLPARIPYHVATEMLLTGRPIDGGRAAELGLVTRATEPGAALQEALGLAAEIAGNGPTAIDVSKRILALATPWPTEEVWRRHDELAVLALESAEAQEGAEAFAQRRPPAWRAGYEEERR
jgi:enoyl-CoA hydratase